MIRQLRIFLALSVGAGVLLLNVFSNSALSAPLEGFAVCNEAGEPIWVALAFHEENEWTTKGWWRLGQTECRQLRPSIQNTRFYLYAEDQSGKIWGANHPLCINPTDVFEISRANEERCDSKANFFSVWTPNLITGDLPQSYVYTFGPGITDLNNPRAER